MTHSAKILADSLSPDGVRLTTFEITFPRIVLAEFNTHRMFSRNSASSRAIPVEKMIKMVMENPYVSSSWGKNQKGMQADQEVSPQQAAEARAGWLNARDCAVIYAKTLGEIGVHKQITNRLLEPFMWHTVIVTSTEWSNFFHLRDNPQAHPDIQKIAHMMRELYASPDRQPKKLDYGEWHLPLVSKEEHYAEAHLEESPRWEVLRKVSVGRCARVSYLTHDGKRDLSEDIRLHDQLLQNGHLSPFEHVARPVDFTRTGDRELCVEPHPLPWKPALTAKDLFCGNFRGWVSLRKTIPGEADILAPR